MLLQATTYAQLAESKKLVQSVYCFGGLSRSSYLDESIFRLQSNYYHVNFGLGISHKRSDRIALRLQLQHEIKGGRQEFYRIYAKNMSSFKAEKLVRITKHQYLSLPAICEITGHNRDYIHWLFGGYGSFLLDKSVEVINSKHFRPDPGRADFEGDNDQFDYGLVSGIEWRLFQTKQLDGTFCLLYQYGLKKIHVPVHNYELGPHSASSLNTEEDYNLTYQVTLKDYHFSSLMLTFGLQLRR